jgi:hypothetical protein
MKTQVDLDKVLEDQSAERIAERLSGKLSESEQPVWGGDFAASGDNKNLPPPPTPLP